jgi:hypothetical protein
MLVVILSPILHRTHWKFITAHTPVNVKSGIATIPSLAHSFASLS